MAITTADSLRPAALITLVVQLITQSQLWSFSLYFMPHQFKNEYMGSYRMGFKRRQNLYDYKPPEREVEVVVDTVTLNTSFLIIYCT